MGAAWHHSGHEGSWEPTSGRFPQCAHDGAQLRGGDAAIAILSGVQAGGKIHMLGQITSRHTSASSWCACLPCQTVRTPPCTLPCDLPFLRTELSGPFSSGANETGTRVVLIEVQRPQRKKRGEIASVSVSVPMGGGGAGKEVAVQAAAKASLQTCKDGVDNRLQAASTAPHNSVPHIQYTLHRHHHGLKLHPSSSQETTGYRVQKETDHSGTNPNPTNHLPLPRKLASRPNRALIQSV